MTGDAEVPAGSGRAGAGYRLQRKRHLALAARRRSRGCRAPRRAGRRPPRPNARAISPGTSASRSGRLVADALGAVLIRQLFAPRHLLHFGRANADSKMSELNPHFRNAGLSEADKAARARDNLACHERIEFELERRGKNRAPNGVNRIAQLYTRLQRHGAPTASLLKSRSISFASPPSLTLCTKEEGLIIGDNEPYFVCDTTTTAARSTWSAVAYPTLLSKSGRT